jgi:hypothetical protein
MERNHTRTYHHNWPGGHEQQNHDVCTTTISIIIYPSLNVAVEMTFVNVKYNGWRTSRTYRSPSRSRNIPWRRAQNKVVTMPIVRIRD